MFDRSMQGAVHVVRGKIPLNAEAVESFKKSFSELLAAGQPMVVFDMTEIPLIDSVGLEAMLDIQDQFCRFGGNLKLATPNPLCKDILHATSVDEYFGIYERLIDAVGSFSK